METILRTVGNYVIIWTILVPSCYFVCSNIICYFMPVLYCACGLYECNRCPAASGSC